MSGHAPTTPAAPSVPGRHGWPPAPGLRRERLLDRLRSPAHLRLILAPAGCGKTTLLAQYCSEQYNEQGSCEGAGPIVWHRTDRQDIDPVHFTATLARELLDRGVLREVPEETIAPGGFMQLVEELAAAGPATLVLDDVHLLLGSPTETCIETLLCRVPQVSVVLASRRGLGVNLCRMEIAPITIITADDLRFRSWEVEALFRDVYREPLPPDDIAALARRTEGWAACLQLFHLSTQSRSLSDRRRALSALSGGARLARAYLARTVLEELPARLRTFLTRTCVFEVLTARRCDRLLGTSDAQQRLEELEGLGALTTSTDGGRTFHYHEVLRRHLEGALRDELGASETRRWYARAAALLEECGALGEAVRAHLRVEHWAEATRLLRASGARVIADEPSIAWHDLVSRRILDEDPWLSMALASRFAAEGRLSEAAQRYRHAEALFPDKVDRQRAAWDRRLVELWAGGPVQPELHWLDRLRASVRSHPGSVRIGETPGDQLCAAVELVLTGNIRGAGGAVRDVLDEPSNEARLGLAARLVQAVIDRVAGVAEGGSAEQLAHDAERIGALWVARQARVVCALGRRDAVEIGRVAAECDAVGDGWGALLACAAQALCRFLAGEPAAGIWRDVLARCRALDAGSLEAWSLAFLALAAAGQREPDAASLARSAESLCRTTGVWGAQVLTALALAVADPASGAGHLRQARALAETNGLPWPEAVAARLLSDPVPASPPPVAVRLHCLGDFVFEAAGRPLDWAALRPRAATMLRLLAINTPRPVHRELLLQLWPDLPADRALHSMQVAVSSVRSVLAPSLPEGWPALQRHGEAYALVLPTGSEIDLVEFATALAAAQHARFSRAVDAERAALGCAVTAYRGELLPGDGSAEWVIDAREQLRQQAAGAAGRLAELERAGGNPRAAVDAARRSVDIDPFRDASWRVLIAALADAGEPAAAARARQDYAEVLRALDIPGPLDISVPRGAPLGASAAAC